MAADIIITAISNSIKADSDIISMEFGTQSLPLPLGGIVLNNAKVPTLGVFTETILAFRNTNVSGYRFNHTTTNNINDLGIFKLESFVNDVVDELFQITSDTLTLTSLDIDLNGNKIVNSALPFSDNDLTTKKYVDDAIAAGGGGTGPGSTWTGNVIAPIYGGTGIANNNANTLTVNGAVLFGDIFQNLGKVFINTDFSINGPSNADLQLVLNSTNVILTIPTTGTVALLSNRLDQLAAPNVDLSIGGNKLLNVASGTNPTDGINRNDLTTAIAGLTPSSITLTGSVTGSGTGTVATSFNSTQTINGSLQAFDFNSTSAVYALRNNAIPPVNGQVNTYLNFYNFSNDTSFALQSSTSISTTSPFFQLIVTIGTTPAIPIFDVTYNNVLGGWLFEVDEFASFRKDVAFSADIKVPSPATVFSATPKQYVDDAIAAGGGSGPGSTWTGNVIQPQYGGTGINNSNSNTMTIGGVFETNTTFQTGGSFETNGIFLTAQDFRTDGLFETQGDFIVRGTYDTGAVTVNGDLIISRLDTTRANLQLNLQGDTVLTVPLTGTLATLLNRLDQFATPTADLSIGGNKLINVASGVNPTDAVNRADLTAAVAGGGSGPGNTWTGNVIQPIYGGTGVANANTKTITLGGTLETQGTFLTGGLFVTNGTFQTDDDFIVQGSLATKSVIIGGNLDISRIGGGTGNLQFNLQGLDTNLTLPLLGTVATLLNSLDQFITPVADLSIGNHKLINVASGTNPTDAVNRNDLTTAISAIPAGTVTLGGDVTGSGLVGSTITTTITNVAPSKISGYPANSSVFLRGDGTWNNQTLDQVGAPLTAVSMNAKKLINLASGTSPTDAVNKSDLTAAVNSVSITLTGDITGSGSGSIATSLNSNVFTANATQTFTYNDDLSTLSLYNNANNYGGGRTVFNLQQNVTPINNGGTTVFGIQGAKYTLLANTNFASTVISPTLSLDIYQNVSPAPGTGTKNIFTCFRATSGSVDDYIQNYAVPVFIGTSTTSIFANLMINGGVQNVASEDSCIRAYSNSNAAKVEIQCTNANGRLWELRADNAGSLVMLDRTASQARLTIDNTGLYYGSKPNALFNMFNNATGTTITTGGSFVKIVTGGTNTNIGNGFTSSANRLTYSKTIPSNTMVQYAVDVTHNGNPQDLVQFRLYLNGVSIASSISSGQVASNTGFIPNVYRSNFTGMAYLSFNLNDYVEVWCTHATSGRSITAVNLTLTAVST